MEPVQPLALALLEIVMLERNTTCKTQGGRAASFPELPLKRCYHKNNVNRWPQEPLFLLNPSSCLAKGAGNRAERAALPSCRSQIRGLSVASHCCTVKSPPSLSQQLLAPKACRSPACTAPCAAGLPSITVTRRVV